MTLSERLRQLAALNDKPNNPGLAFIEPLLDASEELDRLTAQVAELKSELNCKGMAISSMTADRQRESLAFAATATVAMRCAEYFDKIPTTSEHLFRGDLHNCPSGNCLKCGEPIQSYNERQVEAWKRLQPAAR